MQNINQVLAPISWGNMKIIWYTNICVVKLNFWQVLQLCILALATPLPTEILSAEL